MTNLLELPWLEIAILLSLAGAGFISRIRDPLRASQWGLAFTGSVLACTILAGMASYLNGFADSSAQVSLTLMFLGERYFLLDELSAPLVPMVAILHFLTALATSRIKMRRFSFSWSLVAEAIRLATFSSTTPWLLITLLCVNTLPPLIELASRRRPIRMYALHMGLFVGLLVVGWNLAEPEGGHTTLTILATIAILIAMLVRCGTLPAHAWILDWFENASFGNALLYVTPLVGVYATVRLVLPIAPDWVLRSIGTLSVVTAVYAAAMATIQRDMRRFFAYLFLSHASLVMVGLELVDSISLTGALSLWFSVALSMHGFGLTLRALEARFGRLALTDFHGLYDSSPALAICFLVTGLASVGFPGTLGFVSMDLLVEGAIEANVAFGVIVIIAAALNSIAVLRAYSLLFTGARHTSTVSLELGTRERIAVLTLSAMIFAGGMLPQPGLTTRQHAADVILQDRKEHLEAKELAAWMESEPE